MSNDVLQYELSGQACLAQSAYFFFSTLCFFSLLLFFSLPPSHSWSVSSHSLCLCCFPLLCLCQTSTLHSPSSLKPTPWQPVAASLRKVDNLPLVPQQPNATSDSEACYIINQKQPRGAVEDGIVDKRESARDRELEREGGQVPNCSINFRGETALPHLTGLALAYIKEQNNIFAHNVSES